MKFSILIGLLFLCLITRQSFSVFSKMDCVGASSPKEFPLGLDASLEEEYFSQSSLLQDFTSIPNIDKAWTFTSDGGTISLLLYSLFFGR